MRQFLLIIITLAAINPGVSQVMTSLDSLYNSDSLHLGSRVLYKPIQLWQKFSYRTPVLNCQFDRSCSNFMVDAMQEKGVLPGIVIGTDRIVRCNPAARHYHLQQSEPKILADGRLLEHVEYEAELNPGKSPALAAGLSILPGLGRTYAGHPIDGLFSFIFVAGFSFNAYQHQQLGNSIHAAFGAGIAGLFWLADIYGAHRTAALTPSDP